MSTTTIQTKRYYHYRRRNRTQTITSPTSNSLNQQRFGIIINVYEPTDTTTAISLTTAQIPWWK
ncbi:unnamed protein product, partial [Rotaria magnacalcarata]